MSFYRWKTKYGGLEVSEAKRTKELAHEDARLKRLLAEAELDKAMLKDVIGKKLHGMLRTKVWSRTRSAPVDSIANSVYKCGRSDGASS